MSWKKNVFSYILWIVYTGAVCVGILGLSAFACSTAGYPAEYGFAVAGAYLLLIGLLVLLGRRFVLKKEVSETFPDKRQYKKVMESLTVVLLLAAGLWLRISQLMWISDAASGAAYLEAAYVTAGGSVPQVVHGATYFYLWLLHMLFFVFGNHVAVALILQIVLQLSGAFVWYFAVRKLAGVVSAVVSFAFLMLSPYMVGICAEVSPAFLLFLFYCIVLCCVAGCLNARRNPVWAVLAAAAIGIILYLDILGATLFLFFVSVLTLECEKISGFWRSKGALILYAVLGAAVGFFFAIGMDAWTSGKTFGNVLWAWYKLYQPSYSMALAENSIYGKNIWDLVDVILLFGGMAAGCFSFWCSKKRTRQGVWIALAIALTALLALQMESANVGSGAYLYIVFAVLAGIGIEAVFVKDTAEAVAERADDAGMESAEKKTCADVQMSEEPETGVEIQESAETETVVESQVTVPEQKMPSKIQFLDNPLPVPKKHVPKTLDYRIQSEEGDQFDLDVTEDDDFDI